jgi:DNA-binding LytR/AlgR family response regulator
MTMTDVSAFLALEQVLAEWIPPDASVAVAAQEQYVRYRPGEFDLRLKPGDRVRPGSVAERVLRSGQRIETEVDASVYGMPYHGVGYPLHEQVGLPAALVVILPPRFLHQNTLPSVVIGRDGEIWKPIPVHDIAWFESYEKRTWLHTPEGKYTTIFTLRALEDRLPRGMFLRIHRSYLVNIHWIHAIGRDMHGSLYVEIRHPLGQRLPVAQSFTRQMRTILGF